MNEKFRHLAYKIYRQSKKDGWISGLSAQKLEKEIDRQYYNQFGKHIDFSNPLTFNERVQWLKAHDVTPKKTECADKLAVRKIIAKEVGEDVLPAVYRIWQNSDDIDFSGLPETFMLKANHGSGMYLHVDDSKSISVKAARDLCKHWLDTNFANSSFEMHYAPIPRSVFAEEYIDDIEWEYQAWCFDGRVEFIAAIHEPHGKNEKQFFSPEWERMPFVSSKPIYQGDIKKPVCLGRILECSKKLSFGFPLLRMDWYYSKGKGLMFSEMTFTPASGYLGWFPAEYNERLANLIKIPIKYT